MKRFTLSIVLTLIIQITGFSQGCLPDGITFTTQEQIDNFQINYPGCTEIEGGVYINEGNITNLSGLNVITSIGGNLYLSYLYLESLEGLENLSYIGGSLNLQGMETLSNMIGLNSLTMIEGNLYIDESLSFTSFNGLNNLTFIGGDFDIINIAIENFNGLDNLTHIGDEIYFSYNFSLTSLSGLENINVSSLNSISISQNYQLSECNIQNICDYLSAPSGIINIYDNAPGCNNPVEIANNCGINLPCLPFGNYYFHTQAEINEFQSNYPECSELLGNTYIYGIDITNVEGLGEVNSILGNLEIRNNDNLHSLTGLNNITNIEGNCIIIGNDSLSSIAGLLNISTIGGDLVLWGNNSLINLVGLENLTFIGKNLDLNGNDSLSSLTGLDNISSIGESIKIINNDALLTLSSLGNITNINGNIMIWLNAELVSLNGLENIYHNSISSISIENNPLLSHCDVQSVCDYLSNSGSIVGIWGNATGCNSQEEVEEACLVDINPIDNIGLEIIIYPNPAQNEIFISVKDGIEINNVNIYNQIGQLVIHKKGKTQNIDISLLQKGMYIIELSLDNRDWRSKLIIE